MHAYILPLLYVLSLLHVGPDAVANVQVFIYRPNTDNSVLTGLVTWDPIEFALNYTVTVRQQGGAEIPNVCLHVCVQYVLRYVTASPSLPLFLPPTTHPPSLPPLQVIATNEAGSNTMTPLTVPFTVNGKEAGLEMKNNFVMCYNWAITCNIYCGSHT